MGKTVTLGGNRLGSGKKLKVTMHGYERSTHNLSYLWRSSMAPGTLVPFMVQIGLPGDTFDIQLNADVKTHPTVGPLFGSFKLQLDVFNCPMRLYNKQLHNNKLGVGNSIRDVKFPWLYVTGNQLPEPTLTGLGVSLENQQINQSSLLAYLGCRGVGGSRDGQNFVTRQINAMPILAYWDIYKQYYANKQEDDGYVMHGAAPEITSAYLIDNTNYQTWEIYPNLDPMIVPLGTDMSLIVQGKNLDADHVWVDLSSLPSVTYEQLIDQWEIDDQHTVLTGRYINGSYTTQYIVAINIPPYAWSFLSRIPTVYPFPLENIDEMRDRILSASSATGYNINSGTELTPYSWINENINLGLSNDHEIASIFPMEGLAIKTYQSDIFNNWINTEWIDGENGITAVTAIDVSEGLLTIDTLNIQKKVYDMLNRIALAGGSYQDWSETVYDHETFWRAETPIYCGGLSKEIVFQEVISTVETTGEDSKPQGNLSGKGVMADKHKGGYITVKIDEPSYIIGIVSITPRVDYSQGNDWHINILTLDDLHKPALDGIGYQDLITDQMAFWDTTYDDNGLPVYKSAGKQPAWLHYMTNYNRCYGNFADPNNEMFMTLNRRYTYNFAGGIADLTTYIDPSKFNYAFAQTDSTAQNFWVQISNDIEARRKMSTKIIPNL